jgi:isopentenyl phosphate kinase
VKSHLQARLGEAQGGGATGHPAADDDRIGQAAEAPLRDRRRRLVQPVAGQLSKEVARRIGTNARLPTSRVPLTVLKA